MPDPRPPGGDLAAGPLPPDHAQRRRIAEDLDHTLFVTAGAGSGKTASLVQRVVALVLDGGIDITAIAAITFTEKAAAELADRLRRAFEAVALDRSQPPSRVAGALDALRDLDAAAIGTLHAFAQRLLMENPIEVGLPPDVEVLDEIASAVEFDARWSAFVRSLFEDALRDASLERALLLLLAAGVRVTDLRALAVLLGDNWDLVEARGDLADLEPVLSVPTTAEVEDLLGELAAATGFLAVAPDGDTMTRRLLEVEVLRQALVDAADEVELVAALGAGVSFKVGNCGNAKFWGPVADLGALRARLAPLGPRLQQWRTALLTTAMDRVLVELGAFTRRAVDERRAAGRLEFHDLLVLARQLLTHSDRAIEVRRRLHGRYQRLLLDEFQDTDPIQVELAVGIAADPAVPWPASGSWRDLPVEPGRLFFVGDPKQSVYRFRRADIELYLAAQQRFEADVVTLSANFRTVEPVLEWVNQVFAELIQPVAGSQPAFQQLVPTRHDPLVGSSVTVLGEVAHAEPKLPADDLRRREVADVAAAITTAVQEGWEVVVDGILRPTKLADITVLLPTRTSLELLEEALDQAGLPFRAEASSLVYGTREVRDLLAVARAADDPSDELSVVTALRSAAFGCSDRDLFAFTADLGGTFDHQDPRLRRSWQPPEDADPEAPGDRPLPDGHPVVDGLRYLGGLHRDRFWSSPSELLDRIVRERRLLELGVGRGRARDVWRRLRFVVDQARAWAEADGGSLRNYLTWAAQQGDDDRVTESVLPETDDDAVRIMTVHAAKGLEFPIVVVAGATTRPGGFPSSVRVAWTPGRLDYKVGRVGSDVTTPGHATAVANEQVLDLHERIRLLYVACTRARDHLIVSLHRLEGDAAKSQLSQANGALLARGTGDASHWSFPPATPAVAPVPDASPGTGEVPTPPTADQVASWDASIERWRARRGADLASARAPRTWSATALAKAWLARRPDLLAATAEVVDPADPASVDDAPPEALPSDPGLDKEPADLELPPWNKGRYGTAVGRAVHAVLQTVDLAAAVGAPVTTPPAAILAAPALAAFEGAVATQAAGEGVTHLQDLVAALAWSALTSDRVARAVAAPQRWREVYVGTPVDGHPVEGYLDLLYRLPDDAPDGRPRYVVVDHKTDTTGSDADRAVLLDRYRGQGATYALAVEAITGGTVAACVFLLLDPSGARELVLEDDGLRQAMDEVRAILTEVGAAG